MLARHQQEQLVEQAEVGQLKTRLSYAVGRTRYE